MNVNNILGLVLVIVFLLTLICCENDNEIASQTKLLGLWVSVGKSDTLEFTNEKDL